MLPELLIRQHEYHSYYRDVQYTITITISRVIHLIHYMSTVHIESQL